MTAIMLAVTLPSFEADSKNNIMNAAKNACFRGNRQTVLDFITGLLLKDSVKKVNITRENDRWKVDVSGLHHEKKRTNLVAGLHDLYW